MSFSGTSIYIFVSKCFSLNYLWGATGQVIALYLRSKQKLVQKGDCPSVEKADNYLESKNMLSSERETEEFSNEGATPKEEVTKSDGDRVARARASRKLEAMFASTACTQHELLHIFTFECVYDAEELCLPCKNTLGVHSSLGSK